MQVIYSKNKVKKHDIYVDMQNNYDDMQDMQKLNVQNNEIVLLLT